jgi:hypothetical protein
MFIVKDACLLASFPKVFFLRSLLLPLLQLKLFPISPVIALANAQASPSSTIVIMRTTTPALAKSTNQFCLEL